MVQATISITILIVMITAIIAMMAIIGPHYGNYGLLPITFAIAIILFFLFDFCRDKYYLECGIQEYDLSCAPG